MEFKMILGPFKAMAVGEYFTFGDINVAVKIENIYDSGKLICNAVDIETGKKLLVDEDQETLSLVVNITSKV